MSRRQSIEMTEDEQREFLASHRDADVATISRDGSPHLVAMWYGLIDGEIVMWTYAKSQKAHNLRRDPRIACLIESGETYAELQGVSIIGMAEVSDDPAFVPVVGEAILAAWGPEDFDDASRETMRQTAPKRVAITVKPTRVATWDHRKLGGRY